MLLLRKATHLLEVLIPLQHLIHHQRWSPCLAAARARSGSDSHLGCHSIPSRRFATLWGRHSFQYPRAASLPPGRSLYVALVENSLTCIIL